MNNQCVVLAIQLNAVIVNVSLAFYLILYQSHLLSPVEVATPVTRSKNKENAR